MHSPEFEFEKDFDNVTKATMDKGVVWPVALDNDFATWQNYSNRYWPAKYLIDKDGVVRYSHFGEGRYAETEGKIRELLEEAGASVLEDKFSPSLDQKLDPTYLGSPDAELTREVYAGYRRNLPDRLYGGGGYVGQEAYYKAPEEVVTFALPGELTPNVLYFHGRWRVGPENIDHGRKTQGHEDSINLVFSARSVNAVLTSGSGRALPGQGYGRRQIPDRGQQGRRRKNRKRRGKLHHGDRTPNVQRTGESRVGLAKHTPNELRIR